MNAFYWSSKILSVEGIYMTDILICTEDPVFSKQLQNEIKEVLQKPCKIHACQTAEELREECIEKYPQILFMDISVRSEDEDGISLVQHLFPGGKGTAVIFVAGYTEFRSDIYEADHVYTLVKPIQRVSLEKALKKAMTYIERRSTVFAVRFNGEFRKIDLDDVLYMESFYRKIRIRLWNENIECYGSFGTFPPFVVEHMIHSHKSFLVNPDYIRAIDKHKFVMENGEMVPISRNNYNECRQRFFEYFGQCV